MNNDPFEAFRAAVSHRYRIERELGRGGMATLVRGNQLTVVVKQVKNEKDVPPVAHWDYDTVHQRQYIGIKCGGEWCEIGNADFETSAGYRPGILHDEPSGVVGLAPASSTEKERVVLV